MALRLLYALYNCCIQAAYHTTDYYHFKYQATLDYKFEHEKITIMSDARINILYIIR